MITKKLNSLFSADSSMKMINFLFWLSVFIPNRHITLWAYTLWLLFLAYSIKHATSPIIRIAYGLLSLYAVIVLTAMIYIMIDH